jgi:hypothetical protein
VHVREVEHRPDPAHALRDVHDVVDRPEIPNAPHHLDAEGNAAVLGLEAVAKRLELLDDGGDRVLAASSEQEAGMEHDELGSARRGDSRAAIKRSDRRCELPPARLEVPHEAEQRRVHRERDAVLSRHLAEALGERVVHPEAALEVDLARCVAVLEEELDGDLWRLPRRHVCGADADVRCHRPILIGCDVIAFSA